MSRPRSLRATAASVAALTSAALLAGSARAQDLEPRAYANVPVGMNFLIAGYTYSEGDVATDTSAPLEDGKVEIHGALLAYARSFGFFGRSAKVDVVIPYAWLDGSATFAGEDRDRSVDGFADPRVRVSLNFLGGPALSFEEYTQWKADLIVGASVLVTVPLGQYDSDKLVNLGQNRWSIKPELGVSKEWWDLLTTELSAGLRFYSDNDDYFGKRRSQDPIFSAQAHIVYKIWRGIWCAFDATYYTGGETTIDGEENDDRQRNARLGGTLSLPVNRYNSIKLYASTGVAVRTGGDYDLVGIAWQVRWGGGL
jgi:hypothetical protein